MESLPYLSYMGIQIQKVCTFNSFNKFQVSQINVHGLPYCMWQRRERGYTLFTISDSCSINIDCSHTVCKIGYLSDTIYFLIQVNFVNWNAVRRDSVPFIQFFYPPSPYIDDVWLFKKTHQDLNVFG